MSLKKQYDEKKSMCKVTFKVTKDIARSASQVYLAGDFNNWEVGSLPMKRHKNGEFTASLDLERNREYQFKYLIDGWEWKNETEADKFVSNEFQSENSVVVI
ncbi:MAG TPA: isoamylase early set domain-containing protein [Bacteroidales bacterium]